MVIKGTRRNRPKKLEPPERPSPTEYIDKIAALKRQPLKEDALDILHELAKLVSPIMAKHNFKVGIFCEMFPKKQELLGLNVNGGQKIMIRLRQHHNNLQFISKSELVGTVLHELTHNIYGPHNRQFYDFLDKITREFEDMMARNSFNIYGEVNFDNMFGNNSMLNRAVNETQPFQGKGNKLGNSGDGGSSTSPLSFKEVNRLGGTARRQQPLKKLILRAVELRLKDNKKCHEISASQEEEDAYVTSMQKAGELPSNEDLDIIVIDHVEEPQQEKKKRKRNPGKSIDLSGKEIIEID